MQIGLIGLGKMGFNLALQLQEKGYTPVVYNRDESKVYEAVNKGIEGAFSFRELSQKLTKSPRVYFLLISHTGVDEVLKELREFLEPGDFVIDGGNSYYKDSMRRYRELRDIQVYFLDVGISGGPEGARSGGSLMIGGDQKAFNELEKLFKDISVPEGYAYLGTAGAGHYTKMIHNGIEYGMMQAIAEGFTLLHNSEFDPDLQQVISVYQNGSVIESALLNWLSKAYEEFDQDLQWVSGSVKYSGEGHWTVETAAEKNIDVPVISEAVEFREQSANRPSYQGKVLSALRWAFGGHNPYNDNK